MHTEFRSQYGDRIEVHELTHGERQRTRARWRLRIFPVAREPGHPGGVMLFGDEDVARLRTALEMMVPA